jgi:hypothetical protein
LSIIIYTILGEFHPFFGRTNPSDSSLAERTQILGLVCRNVDDTTGFFGRTNPIRLGCPQDKSLRNLPLPLGALPAFDPLRESAGQGVAVCLQHAAFGDQPAHKPRGRYVEGVVGGDPCGTIRTVSIRPSAVRPVLVATSSALRCLIGLVTVPSNVVDLAERTHSSRGDLAERTHRGTGVGVEAGSAMITLSAPKLPKRTQNSVFAEPANPESPVYGAIQRHLGFDRPHRENHHMAKKALTIAASWAAARLGECGAGSQATQNF